ncbi:hypothetical protein F4781DRAFT_431406 [Annulohypoxylon bovei var. microspora]|nr:hypothetical protein F4781DRAFT_431406 [Annulohypoxylon bovei var. microspora]
MAPTEARRAANRRKEKRRRAKRRAERESRSQPKPQGQLPQVNLQQPPPRPQSNWEVHATDPNLLNFSNCTQENLRGLLKGAHVEGLNQPFGHPGHLDYRFANIVHETRSITDAPDSSQRSLEDVLKDHPEMKFLGLPTSALISTADSIFQVANEVTLKWLRKWCRNMKLSDVFDRIRAGDDLDEVAKECEFVVPSAALGTKFTGTTLAKLYQECHSIYVKHSVNPQARDVTLIADHCITLCRVLKDEKTAEFLELLKKFIHWLDIGLGCKLLEVQKEASRKIVLDAALDPTTAKERESKTMDLAYATYNVIRMEYSIEMLVKTKATLEYTSPSELGDHGSTVSAQASGESTPVSSAHSSDVIYLTDSTEEEDSEDFEDSDESDENEVGVMEVIEISDSE